MLCIDCQIYTVTWVSLLGILLWINYEDSAVIVECAGLDISMLALTLLKDDFVQ